MKIFFPILLSLCFCFNAYAFSGKVVNVIDGDTLNILQENKTLTKVRLYGIDTPEKRQPFGQQARKVLANMVTGKKITIEEYGKDRYGRSIGILKISGKNVNREMIRLGVAWVYPASAKDRNAMSGKAWKQRRKRKGVGCGTIRVQFRPGNGANKEEQKNRA